jgi:hypothetical protein
VQESVPLQTAELGWISYTYKDVGAILRDYCNYIHAYKEYQHKKRITRDDSKMLREIGKTIVEQILKPWHPHASRK